MKIAIIRGDFASPWELQNFEPLAKRNQMTLFTGKFPIANIENHEGILIKKLYSPVDLNFGTISRFRMAALNRVLVDAHVLFGLEKEITGYDIAHCAETYYYYTHQALAAKKKGLIKVVVSTVWENIPFNNEGIPGRSEFKTQAFREIDKFLAVTNKSKEALEKEGCHPGKIIVLKPGVDLNKFKPIKVDKFEGLRKRSGIIKYLFVGRLEPEKGILELLEYFERLTKEYTKVELVIVGTGSLHNEVSDYISKHRLDRHIYTLGRVDYADMPKLYSICDVLAHPAFGSATWAEQYGMVLVEALACGLPIVTVNKGSIPDVVVNQNMCVSENDFYPALQRIVSNNTFRNKMSKTALDIAKREYDSTQYAHKLENIYQESLKNG